MPELKVTSIITINAPAAKVWDALVNPDQTKKYMFGCETVSDWKPGSTLDWKGSYDGKEIVFVKGKILEIEPEMKLIYTVIDPNSGMEDIPENYLSVTYNLKEENNLTLLTVIQDGFENAADGQKRYEDTYNKGEGWNPILVQIKKIAEGTEDEKE
ncbi:hypothetical protein BH10BAC5_BH10BAC5_05530 [soil metagenome]